VGFLLCGSGSETGRLRRLARELGVEQNVCFTGFLPRRQLIGVMKDCDVYVSTSKTDGSSSALLEAMNGRLACVVTDIPGNTEWIENEKNGLLFDVGEYRALAALVLRLSKDSDLRAKLGESACSTIRRKIDWQRNFGTLLDRLEALQQCSPSEIRYFA